MVFRQIFFVFQQCIKEVCNRKWCVNSIVYRRGDTRRLTSHSTTHGHSPKRKIVIPWENIQFTVVFIEIIIVSHCTGKAVIVYHKGVNCHIFQDIVYLHIRLRICAFTNILQGFYHALMIFFARAGNFSVPDSGVAVKVIICVIQIRASAATYDTEHFIRMFCMLHIWKKIPALLHLSGSDSVSPRAKKHHTLLP